MRRQLLPVDPAHHLFHGSQAFGRRFVPRAIDRLEPHVALGPFVLQQRDVLDVLVERIAEEAIGGVRRAAGVEHQDDRHRPDAELAPQREVLVDIFQVVQTRLGPRQIDDQRHEPLFHERAEPRLREDGGRHRLGLRRPIAAGEHHEDVPFAGQRLLLRDFVILRPIRKSTRSRRTTTRSGRSRDAADSTDARPSPGHSAVRAPATRDPAAGAGHRRGDRRGQRGFPGRFERQPLAPPQREGMIDLLEPATLDR